MMEYMAYLNLPTKICIIIVGGFLAMQIIGEILEFKGKVVPEFLKVRKYFNRRKTERGEREQTLHDVKVLLSDVNAHYSTDNITKRDSWMTWVNNRADVYDQSIVDINANLAKVIDALTENTKLTEEMFVQSSRDRIIDFATKVSNGESVVSREEFHRIFKVHKKYEAFLSEHSMTNGEVDIAWQIIQDAYAQRIKSQSFIEDVRGYRKQN